MGGSLHCVSAGMHSVSHSPLPNTQRGQMIVRHVASRFPPQPAVEAVGHSHFISHTFLPNHAAGTSVRLVVGDGWPGGAKATLEFPYQPRAELLRPGEVRTGSTGSTDSMGSTRSSVGGQGKGKEGKAGCRVQGAGYRVYLLLFIPFLPSPTARRQRSYWCSAGTMRL